MKCRECKNWGKLAGAKSKNTDYGRCEFINKNNIHVESDDNSNAPALTKDSGIIIEVVANAQINIDGVSIHTDSDKHMYRNAKAYTMGCFFCALFTPF